MRHRWLFRFQLASELEHQDVLRADGIGHARRSATLARCVRDSLGDEVMLLAVGGHAASRWLETLDLPYLRVRRDEDAASRFQPTVVVLDTNYLHPDVVAWYRRSQAFIVNLAPRGTTAQLADLTFSDVPPDILPADRRSVRIGPEYAVIGEDFANVRSNLPGMESKWQPRTAVVSFGGVDQANLTGRVVDALIRFGCLNECAELRVVVGPYYPYGEELRQKIRQFSNLRLITPSMGESIAPLVVESAVGIFGTGITTFEGLAVGVPSLNVGLSELHRRRGDLLEKTGAGRYFGRHDEIDWKGFADAFRRWMVLRDDLERARSRGLQLIDGRGAQRIVQETIRQLEAAREVQQPRR